jgi:hypothetical protein
MITREADVSVLIPTYKYAHLVNRAVSSALASGAGEIIVSDDASRDGTLEALSEYRDDRLTVVEQPTRLGLWPNHCFLCRRATRQWIKILQADDQLLPGGLERMVGQIGAQTTLVWANPIFKDLAGGRTWRRYHLDKAKRFSSDAYLKRLSIVGWELGTPSHMLVRKDALNLSDGAWEDEKSCDVIMGVESSAKGEVVLVPEGAILHGVHPAQDVAQQGFEKGIRRLRNTVLHLIQSKDARVRAFGSIWGTVEALGSTRSALGLLRRRLPVYSDYYRDLLHLTCVIATKGFIEDRTRILRMLARKYSMQNVIAL